MHGTCIKIKS